MQRSLLALGSVLLGLLPGTASSAGAVPNLLLASSRTEPSVAIDPRRPQHIVVSTNTNYNLAVGGQYPTGSFSTTNGGRTFSEVSAPLIAPYSVAADTTVAIDGNGTVFYSYLGETPAYCTTGHSAILLTHSIDGGRSYRAPRIVDVDPADDKPNMAVQTVPGHPSRIFLSWTRFHGAGGRTDVWFSRSLDGGVSFSPARQLISSRRFNVGTTPVVGTHGRVYVVWNVLQGPNDNATGRARILMAFSTDGGAHFASARQVGPTFTHVPLTASPGALRNLTMPAAVAGKDGELYLAWPQVSHRHADGHVDADIVLIRSTNSGHTWTAPIRLNTSRYLDRFMPALAVALDGSIVAAFYDRRSGAGQLDVYLARVRFDGSAHVSPNIRVNQGTSPTGDIYYIAPSSTCFIPGRFFGDYLGLAVDRQGRVCVAWTDTQLHTQDETDVWFARTTLP